MCIFEKRIKCERLSNSARRATPAEGVYGILDKSAFIATLGRLALK
jgi:hypothetical protein